MLHQFNQTVVELVQGNIVDQDVDAIVNAANSTLLGGGGVDGAIHYAAGPSLLAKCATLGGCRTGQAKITPGYRLKARHVIHTVGPIYKDGTRGEAELLASAYRSSLQLATEHKLEHIAFPSISTGAYSFPLPQAAEIALRTVIEYVKSQTDIKLVRFVLWGGESFDAYRRVMKQLTQQTTD